MRKTTKSPGEKIVKDIRRGMRKHYSSEKKIGIVLDGLRGEDSRAVPCRREGISQGLYYKWPKDFMEAGKTRLAWRHRACYPLVIQVEGIMGKIEGGCLCGAVRYRSDAESVMQAVCHCKTCQKISGSTYSFNVAVPEESLVVEGDVATYEDDSGASGGMMYRRFCPKCGSSLYGGGPAYGPLYFIKAGTLDDASWVAPDLHIWAEEKLRWTPIPEGATVVDKNPG